MAVLKPGQPARGTKTGRPIMVLLDLLGRKWMLRVLWELRGDAFNFRDLQQQCGGLSPTVLNRRLAEMREAGIVMLQERRGYRLTPEGVQLLEVLAPLNGWAKRWAARAAIKDRTPAKHQE